MPRRSAGSRVITKTRNGTGQARDTVDLQSVRIFHGSVWFVRAIGFAYFLWHAQTIRFHEIFERSVNPLYPVPSRLLKPGTELNSIVSAYGARVAA